MLNDAIDAYENREFEKAFKLFEPLAYENEGEAQYFLGLLYYDGDGVEKDMQKAVYWLKRAVKRHHVDAANMLMECDSVSTAHTNRF